MIKTKFVLLAAIVLLLNLVWEFSHYPLYIDLTGISPGLHLIIASFTDVILVGIIFVVNSLIRGSFVWMEKVHLRDLLFIVFVGVIFAALIERHALNTGRWAYTSSMPLIYGIGVSPLIQLFSSALLSLIFVNILFPPKKNKV